MSNNSRTYNSVKNIIFGIGTQVIILILNFLSRTIFIKTLGSEYLGVSGLFTNILMVLSLAELGVGNAILYSMYKPIATNDKKKITALMNIYKKIYNVIACIILLLGLLIIPVLKYVVNTDIEMHKVTTYYLLYLINSVVSYLFASRTAILNADQKMYIVKTYTMIFTIVQVIIQIIALKTTKSFEIYLVLQILFTFLTNLYGAIKVKKLYPYLKGKEKLEKKERKTIFENMKSMFLYRIGGVVLNNTDNILISTIVGTVVVGYYSNYYMVVAAITTFTNIIFTSLTASIGNLNVTTENETRYKVFRIVDFASAIIFGLLSIALFVLYNDFINLWIGKEYIIDTYTIFAIIINFYIMGRLNPVSTYRETLGMFKKTKYIFIITAILNIVISIILGNIFGIFGIIIATAICRILTNRWYEPYILYKDYFKVEFKKYWQKDIKYFILTIINCVIIFNISRYFNVNNIFDFILKGSMCVISICILYVLEFHKTEEYKYFLDNIVKKIYKRIKNN